MSFRSKLDRLERGRPAPVNPAVTAEAPAPSAVLDDLRARIRSVLERTAHKVERPPPPEIDTTDLPFISEETELGPLHVRTLLLGAAHRTGHAPVALARSADARLLSLLALDPTLATLPMERALYLDTETTGLSGGTGTVAFLVGLAWFAPSGLVVEQMLVRRLGEEAPMLARVRRRLEECALVITFNGKSFDLPLLRTRLVMNRLPAAPDRPHLDLLHVARRVHKHANRQCRLTALERDVLGFERENDVPSGEVSGLYLHFLRTGDGSALRGVVEHNAWDVVTMASLVGLYGEPLDGSRLRGDDLAGVAHALHRAGDDGALDAASLALDRCGGPASRRVRASIAKARGERDLALADYEALERDLEERGEGAAVRLELAKLYEHHQKSPHRALEMLDKGVVEEEQAQSRRRARLERKAERARDRGAQQSLLEQTPPRRARGPG